MTRKFESRADYLARIHREDAARRVAELETRTEINDIDRELDNEYGAIDRPKLAAILHKLGYRAWTA